MLNARNRFGRLIAIAVALTVVATSLAIAVHEQPAAAAPRISIRGSSTLNAGQISAWFKATTKSPYRATVPVEQLANHFVTEGNLANVRGDIAFVQSVLETGWFSFPAGGYIKPADNNFGGIGAYGDGSHVFRAPSAQIGVRAQMQLLRRYADSKSTQHNIGSTPVAELWNPPSRYDYPGRTHGWAPNWNDLSGRWAASTTYAAAIFGLYDSMLRHSGKSILDIGTRPAGSLDGVTLTPNGIRATGWAIGPGTSDPIAVDFYLNGTMIGRVAASGRRADVGAVYPAYGPNHGYDVVIPGNGGTLCVYGIDPNGVANTLLGPGCRAVTSAPRGSLDTATAGLSGIRTTGWATAPSTAAAINVDFYLNGTMIGRLPAAGNRQDVGAVFPNHGPNHGFSTLLPGHSGTVCVYGIDPAGRENTLLGPGCRRVTGSPPAGSLDHVTTGPGGITVTGWSIAPGTPGPVAVDIYLDGTMIGRTVANRIRHDVGAAYPLYGATHGFQVTIPGAHGTVCAYGIDPNGVANPLLGPGCRSI